MKAAVLFARSDSVYKKIEGLDVYDIERDARSFCSSLPVIAHPPCRAWGRLRHFAKPRDDEKDLAFFAVEQIKKNGGVLEHPEFSTLWRAACLPLPGERDDLGGYTLPISQHWWGHRARKNTWLYILGVENRDLPDVPMVLGDASHVIRGGRDRKKPQVTHAEREHTPIDLALWLVDLVQRVKV